MINFFTRHLGVDSKDLSSYIWLIFLQPLIYFLYKQDILFNTWVLLAIAIMNLINVFLLASMIHYRYEKESTNLQIPQTFLVILNGLFTLSLISFVLTQTNLAREITAVIAISGTGLLLLGIFAVPRFLLNTWTPSSLKKASIIKEILAIPLIVLGLEVSRTIIWVLYNHSFTDNILVTILAITLVAGPACYFLFYFVIRASTTLEYPTKKWLIRYGLFIVSIFINFNLGFLENFIPGA